MKNKGMNIKHPKLRGEWAELWFMARAAEHGLQVTKPWGETARYGFAVGARRAICASAGEVRDVQGERRVLLHGARVPPALFWRPV